MNSIVRHFLLAAFIAALGAGITGTAAADSANDIKYRKAHMKALSGHLGPIFMVLKGEAGDKSHIAAHASALANVAMMVGGLFPAGSGTGDTAALPVIWEKSGEFKEKSRRSKTPRPSCSAPPARATWPRSELPPGASAKPAAAATRCSARRNSQHCFLSRIRENRPRGFLLSRGRFVGVVSMDRIAVEGDWTDCIELNESRHAEARCPLLGL